MKYQAASALFFAALASASYNPHGHGQRFHHRRYVNESTTAAPALTTTAEAPLTTLTVQSTLTSTLFNCGQNATTCAGQVVTKTVDLTTIVCPLTDVESIRSSVISDAATAPVVVEVTQTVVPQKSEDLVKPTPSPSKDIVLSYTLGTGSSQSVVVTTIKNTKTEVHYETKYITYDNSPHTQTVVGVVPEQTTTLSSTTTSTRFVTVPYVKPTGTPAKPADETVDENSPIGDDEEECPPPVTVTVAATTIYETITFTPPAAAPTKPAGGATPIESVSDNDNVRGDASATTDCPEDEATAPATPIESVKNNAGLGGEAKPTTTATPVESVDNNAGTGATSTTDCPLDEQTAAPVPTEEDVEEEAEIVNETVYVIPTKAAATDPRPTGFITKARDTGSSITPAPTGGVYY